MQPGGGAPASPAAQVETLRGQLQQRESEWRSANPEHAEGAPVPDEVKRRDVLWKALERKLERAEAALAAK